MVYSKVMEEFYIKKFLNIIFLCLFFLLTPFLSSCVGDERPSEIDNQVYKVTCEASDLYVFGGTVNATAGQTARVSLTSSFEAYEIIGCTFNGTECTKAEDSGDAKNFTYVMPACNVELKVVGVFKDLNESGPNKFLKFSTDNTYTLQSAIGDSDYNNDADWGSPFIASFEIGGALMTIADILCISSNEDILPSSAITVNKTLSNTSNEIVGGKIIVDRSKASVGTTQLVLHVKSGNNKSYDAIIVASITITE